MTKISQENIEYISQEKQLRESIALWKFAVWGMLLFCILSTLTGPGLVIRAIKNHYSVNATVTDVSGPSITGHGTNARYVYTYYVGFKDASGNYQSGHFNKINKEDAWEYGRGQNVTIYYADGFVDGEQVYINKTIETVSAVILWSWVLWLFELVLVIIYVFKRKKLERMHENIR